MLLWHIERRRTDSSSRGQQSTSKTAPPRVAVSQYGHYSEANSQHSWPGVLILSVHEEQSDGRQAAVTDAQARITGDR